MNDNDKKVMSAIIDYYCRKNNFHLDEVKSIIPADTTPEDFFLNKVKIDIDYTIIRIIAEGYKLSTSAVYSRWQKNKEIDFALFLEEVKKIKPYTAAIPTVPYNWYNSFIFNELLSSNINKHKVFSIEGDATHCITSKSRSYSESLTIYESSQFVGVTMPQLIVYMSIQSILQAADGADSKGEYTISLRQIYEAIYNSRWDKATQQARLELFNLVFDMQRALNSISSVKYTYKAGKTKYTTEVITGDAFFGCCQWQHLQPWDLPEKHQKNYLAISWNREKENNYENTCFIAKKGQIIEFIKYSGRVIHIPQTMIVTKNLKNNIWVNYYLARYITLAANSKNKITPAILFSTIEKYLGSVSRAAIKSIMSNYQQQGLINDYTITAKRIDFSQNDAKKEPQKPKKAKKENEITVLRNEGKEDITPEVIPAAISEREQKIRELNHYYSKHNVTIDGKTLSTDLRQIFSGDWNKGGRLYGGKNSYQSVKSTDRSRLLINGSATVEFDYSCSHLNILYAYVGLQAPADCYSFFPDRQLAKKALLISLNAKSINSAALALSKEWNAVHPSRTITEAQAIEVIEDAIEAHAPIKDYICSGVGSGLQRIDSELAINIITQCKKQGIVALPIHDSFIVPVSAAKQLQAIMTDEYTKYTGGFSCPITTKKS